MNFQILGEMLRILIHNLKRSFRYFGFSQSTTPVLFIRDPELVKSICIKDFDHFLEHQAFTTDGSVDPLWDRNLFACKGN